MNSPSCLEGEFIYDLPPFPEIEYSFKHGLAQEVAGSSLLTEHRIALHALVRDYERRPGVFEAMVYIAMGGLLLRRAAHP
ncbi:hypothetical protein D9M68_06180 [compost metagenome]|nr:hypothetical protein ASL20_15215 [Cupriavidus necator]BDB30280.1 hypothetical protein CTP10_R76970 [Cupriavidus sp. P-10]